MLCILKRSTRTIEENETKWKQVTDTQLSIKLADNSYTRVQLAKFKVYEIIVSGYTRVRLNRLTKLVTSKMHKYIIFILSPL